MREAQLVPFVTAEIEQRFDQDVAQALITRNPDTFANVCRQLNRTHDGDETDMSTALEAIAEDVDDGLADWLAHAENPAAWLYKQL
jgi:hypothetical protein